MLPDLTIDRLHAAYAAGIPVDVVVDQVYAALARADDPGIFIAMKSAKDVKAAAAQLGPFDPVARPLWGVPFAVKDNIDVAGMPTTAACPAFEYEPTQSATAVARLLAAGALLIGKTNLDQFATGLVGVRTPFPVPRNAIDPTLVPGGSSSGSAVAVARGIVALALGTDTAGSGRIPAGLNNIVGLKPSVGAISTAGVVPACRTLDCVSVFASTVDDAWRAFSVMAGPDPADCYSRPIALASPSRPPVLRIGVPDAASRAFFGDALAEAAFDETLADLAAQDVVVREVDLAPFRKTAELLYAGPWVAERYQAIRSVMERRPEVVHPVTRTITESAKKYSAADTFAAMYQLQELKRVTEPVWRDIDVMVVPTMPTIATRAELEADPIGPNSRLGTYTNFVNLLDLAALAVPGRWRADRRPAGVTLIAPRGQDGLLAAVGAAIHARSGRGLGANFEARIPVPRDAVTSAPPGWIEIVVVGAHMSGLALNHELTSLGATFLRTAETTADYRLYALPGGPPFRPGLLRIGDGQGQSAAVEVWALQPAQFAAFVAAIPAPLGLGTLRLKDGTAPKGFLVEARGVDGARDISSFGGWRAYLASAAAR